MMVSRRAVVNAERLSDGGSAYEDTRGQAEVVFTFIANKRGDGFTSPAS